MFLPVPLSSIIMTKKSDAVDLILENLQKSHKTLTYEARQLELETELDETYSVLLEYLKTLRL